MINYCLRKNELLIEKHKVLLWIMFTRGFKHMCGLRERKWLGISDPSSEMLQPRFVNGLEFKMATAAATTVWKTESVSFRSPNTVCGLLFFGLYQPLPDSWAVMCQWALKVYLCSVEPIALWCTHLSAGSSYGILTSFLGWLSELCVTDTHSEVRVPTSWYKY